MRIRLFVIILILFGLSVPVYSATWFVGTGNDGYLNDVNGLFLALGSSPGLKDISVKNFIYEDQSGTAIQYNINRLTSSVQRGDLVFWYYSGHGSYAHDSNMDETDSGSQALDDYDEVIGLINQPDQVNDDDLAFAFTNLTSTGATVITLFDTCYAGGFIGGSSDLDSVPNLIFLGSSIETEESYSYTTEPYSIFTQGLISGLEGFNADSNKDGIILASEWFDFSYDYTISQVSNQHPVFWGDGDMRISSIYPTPVPSSILLLFSACLVLIRIKLMRPQ